jgi:hypothetical protein
MLRSVAVSRAVRMAAMMLLTTLSVPAVGQYEIAEIPLFDLPEGTAALADGGPGGTCRASRPAWTRFRYKPCEP